MDKTYDPSRIEREACIRWQESGCFSATGVRARSHYCIILPPPNVTGNLHMGHAFQDTLMDALTRYHRMLGENTLWQPGMDHAGIATQIIVEKKLAEAGKERRSMGRKAFVDAVWQWKDESGGQIMEQLKRMGVGLDWDRMRFTLDEDVSAAVRKVFVDLYKEGIIYRGRRLVNWDPVLQTAVSDLEVVSTEEKGVMYHVRYPFIDDPSQGMVIATTRPETILADGAVAVHPDDDRFTRLLGRRVLVPFTDRHIEIIADEHVDPSFGSGCVKISGAHDFNDFEVTMRHLDKNIPLINLMTPSACMNDNAPFAYRGLDRFEARKKIVADLERHGYLVDKRDHTYMLPRGDRTRVVVEPFLTKQWFVDAKKLAGPALAAVEEGRIRFVPDSWKNTYFDWMRNIQDWCISRQLWWGHQIPAWYANDGRVFVANDAQEAQRQAHEAGYNDDLRQDEDVLDTWFSSALWPFSSLGWPKATTEMRTFYPTSVLVTGFDIIFFWVARMIMMGIKFTGEVPFREVYVHGLVRDAKGLKMSKSKGNVLDPIDIVDGIGLEALVAKRTSGAMLSDQVKSIEESTRRDFPNGIPSYGCDALRFTFAAMASTGRDIRFELPRCAGYRNFCNKLWNAARFALLRDAPTRTQGPDSKHIIDRWIESRLQRTVGAIDKAYATYRFDLVAGNVYDFVWHDCCDWYLEMAKIIIAQNTHQSHATHYHLLSLMEKITRLVHPLIPYISEEIWLAFKKPLALEEETLALCRWPQFDADRIDSDSEQQVEWIQVMVNAVRRIRSQMNISPARKMTAYLATESGSEKEWLSLHRHLICPLAGLQSISWTDAAQPQAASALCRRGKLYLLLAGVVNIADERHRLNNEMQKLQRQLGQLQHKLNNESFVNKAPAAIVSQVREKHSRQSQSLEHLRDQYALLT